VQDASGNTPIFDGIQPNVVSDIIPANTLKAGTQYSYFLFFDNIAITADNNGEVLLDNRTMGSFSTQAVPEPASALIAVMGIGMPARRADVRMRAISMIAHRRGDLIAA